MISSKMIATAVLSLGLLATTAVAQDPIAGAISARQSFMKLMAFNIGTLGAMAGGKIDYDADAASTAAGNLAKLTSMKNGAFWLQGSDNVSVGNTRALPAIWENGADVGAKFTALVEAAQAMDAAAGGGLDSLKGAIGALGGACGACHKAYRAPEN